MSAELHIPVAARAAFAEHHRLPPPNSSAVDWDAVDRDLRAFSRAVVAAELRRLADELDAWSQPADVLPEPRTLAAVAARLRARADHLEKSGGQS